MNYEKDDHEEKIFKVEHLPIVVEVKRYHSKSGNPNREQKLGNNAEKHSLSFFHFTSLLTCANERCKDLQTIQG